MFSCTHVNTLFFPYKSLEKVHGVSYGDAGGSSQGHPPPVPMHPRGGLIFSAQWLSSRKVVATFVVPLHHSLSLAIHTHFGAGHLVATTSMGSAPSGVRRPSPVGPGFMRRPYLLDGQWCLFRLERHWFLSQSLFPRSSLPSCSGRARK